MTLVKERRQSLLRFRTPSPEEIDEQRARKIVDEMEEEHKKLQEELEKSVASCVTCGKTATYTRQAGWLQGIHHIFTCPDGHESPYRLNGGRLEVYQWLIDQKRGKSQS